jgi:hypothetical protein
LEQITAPAESATSESNEELQKTVSHALSLRNVASAGWLYWITASTLANKIEPEAFVVYRNMLLRDAGDPSDPMERMLIEQIALAHFSIGQLRIKSCSVENAKLAVAFSDSATRLLGELRRCTLALEEYRAKQADRIDKRKSKEAAAKRTTTKKNGVIKPASNGKKKTCRSNELVSNSSREEPPQWLKKRLAFPIPNG